MIATHPRGQKESLLLEHVLPSLLRKPKALVRWSHKEALFPSKVYRKLYQRLKRHASYRAELDYLRILNLVLNVELQELTSAIELVLERETIENAFEEIKELLLIEHRPNNLLDMCEKLNQQNSILSSIVMIL